MRGTARTCLVVCTCCVIALRALATREGREESEKKADDEFNFDFEGFEDEEPELASLEVEDVFGPARRLEPEAEMLPANYKGVKSPGVDHMEMSRPEEDEERIEGEPSDDRIRVRRPRRGFAKD